MLHRTSRPSPLRHNPLRHNPLRQSPACQSPARQSKSQLRRRDLGKQSQAREKIVVAAKVSSSASIVSSDARRLLAPRGYVALAGLGSGQLAEHFAAAHWQVVVFERDVELVDRARQRWIDQGEYGARLAIHHVDSSSLPATDFFATVVLSEEGLLGKRGDVDWPRSELERIVSPVRGVLWVDADAEPQVRRPLAGAGSWRHQYGNLANTANSGDQRIDGALALQWFGGPGPSTMVDRHLRAPAPLAGDGRMFVLAENQVLCVDSYNGSPLWQLPTPRAQRYSIPYDCGYASLGTDELALAVDSELWLIDAATGNVHAKWPLPAILRGAPGRPFDESWGYVAITSEGVVATLQKHTSPRTIASRRQVDVDYGNDQPMVTSERAFLLDARTGKPYWDHPGVIINATIALTDNRVWFVEVDEALAAHDSGRIKLAELLAGEAHLVGLDLASGQVVLRQPIPASIAECRHILYLQASQGLLILSGSLTRDNDSWYRIAVLDAATGELRWEAEHAKELPDAFAHGEQVHHPAIVGGQLVAEPAIYDLTTGRRVGPDGDLNAWRLVRPGHSCGTLSAGGDCLFFRANNPTILDFSPPAGGKAAYQAPAPMRAGCWINIIPADGLVLIPEASASCVCHYTLQTSLALRPVTANE